MGSTLVDACRWRRKDACVRHDVQTFRKRGRRRRQVGYANTVDGNERQFTEWEEEPRASVRWLEFTLMNQLHSQYRRPNLSQWQTFASTSRPEVGQ